MPAKQKKKMTDVLKTSQVAKKSGPTTTMEPRTQVRPSPEKTHLIFGVEEQESAAIATGSGKQKRELRMRKEVGMRKLVQAEIHPIAAESETDVGLESDSPENTDDEEEEELQEEIKSKEYRGDIREALMQIMAELKAIRTVLDAVVKKQEKTDKKVKKLGEITEDTKDRVDKIEDNILAWTAERKRLFEKVDVLENFSRRNNIKIVGLKEGIEGEDPIKFFQDWIPDILQMEEGNRSIEIERAHRALRPKPQHNQNPRSILIKCLRYQDKERILQAAAQGAKKRNGPLMIEGSKVLFYPDISYELLKRRKEFNPVKKALWESGYRFILRYPATLKIFIAEGKAKFFDDYQKAEEFVKESLNIHKTQEEMEGSAED